MYIYPTRCSVHNWKREIRKIIKNICSSQKYIFNQFPLTWIHFSFRSIQLVNAPIHAPNRWCYTASTSLYATFGGYHWSNLLIDGRNGLSNTKNRKWHITCVFVKKISWGLFWGRNWTLADSDFILRQIWQLQAASTRLDSIFKPHLASCGLQFQKLSHILSAAS